MSTTAAPKANVSTKGLPAPWICWSVWSIGAVFYLAVFFLRSAPAVMTAELMRDLHIGAASLGNLSAFYFYFYVALQIPVGALTGSWGPRKLLICGAISAAAGQFLFGATSNFALACAGRAIVGGSTAVGWLIQRFGFSTAFGTAAALAAMAVPYFLVVDRRLR